MASNESFSANPDIYTILGTLGEGSYGDVYKAKDASGNVYAVKKIDISKLARGVDDETKRELREMALNEVRSMKTLEGNKNVVRLYDYFEGNGVVYVSMELCWEGSLKGELDRKQQRGEWFDETTLVNWLAQLVSVLQYCHNQQILHRDIKPQNIFLAAGGRTVKLGDFGIAKVLQTSKTYATSSLGTLFYLPPEAFHEGRYSYKSEVWALGCVLYELMAQKFPFAGLFQGAVIGAIMNPMPAEPLPSVRYSAKLRDFVVSKMLSKNESDRPTMVEILAESFILQEIANMANHPGKAPSANKAEPGGLPRRSESIEPSKTTQNPTRVPTSSPAERSTIGGRLSQLATSPEEPPHQSGLPRRTLNVNVSNVLRASEAGNVATLRNVLASSPKAKWVDEATWQQSAENSSGETPLHRAARFNQVAVLELLWPVLGDKLGFVEDAFHATAIYQAVLTNSTGAVDFLLRQNSRFVNMKESQLGRTVLHAAAERGHVDLCQKLVKNYGADLFAKSNTGDGEQMPVHLAAKAGHLRVVKTFVMVKQELVTQRDGDGNMAIHLAAIGGHTDVLDYFLKDRGQMVIVRGESGRTILHFAASRGHLELCQELVASNVADLLTATDDLKAMAIHVAAYFGQLQVVMYFVSTKPKLVGQKDDNGDLPIHYAALGGATAVVEYFLTEIQQAVGISGKLGRMILHDAAEMGHLELCQLLAEQYHANVFAKSNQKDDDNMPIHLAAFRGHVPVVKYFVETEPKLENRRNGAGNMAIHLAALGGRTEAVDYFVRDRRQPVDIPNALGRTTLHAAAEKGHLDLCEKLVRLYCADLFAKASWYHLGFLMNNWLPIHLAASFGHLDVVKFFIMENHNLINATNGWGSITPLSCAKASAKKGTAGASDVVAYLKSLKTNNVT